MQVNKVLVAPDSFKGSLSSQAVCKIIAEAIQEISPTVEVIQVPLADGGEGTGKLLAEYLGGTLVEAEVSGPLFAPVRATLGIVPNKVGIIEMASCAGLPLMKGKLQAGATTTYGVGELIKVALDYQVKHLILCLGGSATTDGGCGMAAALGVDFLRANGERFVPTGATLQDIQSIKIDKLDPRLQKVKVEVMCDVDNPLYGPKGAAYIFAPQKGATLEEVRQLDAGLRHYAEVLARDLGVKDMAQLPGGGAAGGMGVGCKVFLQGQIQRGIDIILEHTKFYQLVEKVDLVISGEGKVDSQSLDGKVLSGVGKACLQAGKPLILMAGALELSLEEARGCGVVGMFSINRQVDTFEKVKKYAEENLFLTMKNVWEIINL